MKAKLVAASKVVHGEATSTEYNTWIGLIQRCTNPNDRAYKNYGGRGIKVCKRWLKFENFLMDMGRRPVGLQLDRIGNNKGYSKINCRWATRKEQALNRRSTIYLVFEGTRLSASEWAKKLGFKKTAIYHRLSRGWSVSRTLTTPLQVHRG